MVIGFIALLSVVLVVGRHFEATWAGGEGYRSKTPVVTVLEEQTIAVTCDLVDSTRENIVTCSGERKKITFGASTIWMDENTQIVVTENREGSESLTFYVGRIVVQGLTTIHVRELTYLVADHASMVNYGWLSKLDIYAISGDVTEASTVLASGTAQRFDTLAPYDDAEDIDANLADSSAAAFYAWVEGN